MNPIYRKDREEGLEIYSPVSLTSLSEKVMEEIILIAITWHITEQSSDQKQPTWVYG